ncbi:putative 2'-deoxynucleoside 5'-phosphate N-hydrolase 1 [Glandiceps talaboti]
MSGKPNIIFCGSIRGGRQDSALYAKIIEELKAYGNVLSDHVGSNQPEQADADDKSIREKDLKLMDAADVVVTEVTQPSLGVGYDIGRAEMKNKKLLCLFRPSSGRQLSGIVRGAHNGTTFVVKDYEEDDMPDVLKEYFSNQ